MSSCRSILGAAVVGVAYGSAFGCGATTRDYADAMDNLAIGPTDASLGMDGGLEGNLVVRDAAEPDGGAGYLDGGMNRDSSIEDGAGARGADDGEAATVVGPGATADGEATVPAALIPNTTITSTPPNPDRLTTTTLQFASTIASSTFRCKLDSGNYAACTSPRAVTIAGEGPHTFSVYASANGVDDTTPATYTWTLDTAPPSISIEAKPPQRTTSTSASFQFVTEAGAERACRIDNKPFATCATATTHEVSGLGTGTHTFEIRATDAANNVNTASYQWIVEPPCAPTTIEAEALLPVTGWGRATGDVLHAGAAAADVTLGAPLSFTFQGKGLVVYYRKGPSAGRHSISIDGSAAVSILATDAAGWTYQNPTVVGVGLPSAVHTATVSCVNASCQIDYFAVTCN